jgi:cytochrome c2
LWRGVFGCAEGGSSFVWDEQTPERWMADSDAFVSGNDMDFLVTRPEERRDLIAFLKQSVDR